MVKSFHYCLKKRAQALGNPPGWDWVMGDPVVNFMMPALFLLDREGLMDLSDQVKRSSEDVYWQVTASWMRREAVLKPILQALDDENIEVIPLKGAALLESIYKHIGIRPMVDIDLLVRHEDYLAAAEILLDCGMRANSKGDLFEFRKLPEAFWPGELGFSGDNNLHIDMHRDLVTYHWFKIAYPFEIKEVWERRIEQPVCKNHIWKSILSPYDMLAHMCLHLAFHGIQILKNYLDVDLWLRNLPGDWDWTHYLDLADQWQIKSVSYHVFLFSKYFFDSPIPKEVIISLLPSRLDRWVVRKLISPEDILKEQASLGKQYPTLVKFALFDGFSTKWKVFRNLVFPERSWLDNNPAYNHLFDHWAHISEVLLRGD